MLLGMPRSGTTWASNWLTTDTTLCLHDPLFQYHYDELDSIESDKTLGVSCSGLFLFPDWVNAHPARKVIVHRDIAEIGASLERIGLPATAWATSLDRLSGIHVHWTKLFDAPHFIYEYLLQRPFDTERHALLKAINVQPHFPGVRVNKDVTKTLLAQLVA